MNELGQLYQEATETSRPPSARAVTESIQRRLRRRRTGRFGVGVLAAAALVAGGVAWHGGIGTPSTSISAASQLPADRAVGTGEYLQPQEGKDGTTVLHTTSGARYDLPGRIGPTAAALGTPLSPDGRWVVTSVGNEVVARDLTSHRTYRTARAGKDGFPVAWSADGRWLVLRAAPNDNVIHNRLYRVDLTNGTVRQLAIGNQDADRLAAILPNGHPVFQVPRDKPRAKPTAAKLLGYATGEYQEVDPDTGTALRYHPVYHAQVWRAQHTSRTHPATLSWVPQARTPLVVSPDNHDGAAAVSEPDNGQLTIGKVQILGDERPYGSDPTKRGSAPGNKSEALGTPFAPAGVPADTAAAVREWRPVSLVHGKLTLLGRTQQGSYIYRITVNFSDGSMLSGQKVDYPAGSLPAGLSTMAY
ncbi:hypothetical protein AB0I55_18785 [Actinocatenispora sera]|uniref:TolB family protein n=1 Tax=Actinocatenispora sera TaxID=390989 RepID=UPI0033FB88D6